MKVALVIGGNSGIGLSTVFQLLERDYHKVYIVGKDEPNINCIPDCHRESYDKKVFFKKCNLISDDLSFLDGINDIDTLIITAGFGRVALFEELSNIEAKNLIKVNFESIVNIVKHYYEKIKSNENFYTSIVTSISGRIVSPFFSVYGAAKAGLRFFIENLNCELEATGALNRILEVSPGHLKGTNFYGNENNLSLIETITNTMIQKMFERETLYIPDYKKVYSDVIERYIKNPKKFGQDSYNYKINSGRLSSKPQVIIGYLSGTFDLFHIGHLNLLKRAKEQCDYLIVGVHDSGAWKGKETIISFDERCKIVSAIKYVDKVICAPVEDSDVWKEFHYNKLFVGSDYKDTERFNRYEKMFKGIVDIVYFPYTKGISSTQLRDIIHKNKK